MIKHLLIIALLLSTGCTNTQRINRHLRISKRHLFLAQALGAKMDSVKTVNHDSAEISGIHDDKEKDTDVNPTALDSLCEELRRQVESYAADAMFKKEHLDGYRSPVTLTGTTLGVVSKIQKTVCPDVKKDSTYEQDIIIQGKHFKNKIRVQASSQAGKASLKVDAPALEIPFVSQSVEVTAKPGNEPTFMGKLLRGAGLILIGVVIGFILGKVLKFGVNL